MKVFTLCLDTCIQWLFQMQIVTHDIAVQPLITIKLQIWLLLNMLKMWKSALEIWSGGMMYVNGGIEYSYFTQIQVKNGSCWYDNVWNGSSSLWVDRDDVMKVVTINHYNNNNNRWIQLKHCFSGENLTNYYSKNFWYSPQYTSTLEVLTCWVTVLSLSSSFSVGRDLL